MSKTIKIPFTFARVNVAAIPWGIGSGSNTSSSSC